MVIGTWKGKQQSELLSRMKAVMPAPFNSLCLLTMYVIVMKVMMLIMPNKLGELVFVKGVTYTSLRERLNKKLGFRNLTFYSMRYAAAEEEKKSGIPEAWTRRRMGHASSSNMKDHYANNKDDRVMFEDTALPLGVDIEDDADGAPQLIKLHFDPVNESGVSFEMDWIDKVFDDAPIAVRKDFLDTHKEVKAFIETQDAEAKEKLIERFKSHSSSVASAFKGFPLGFAFRVPDVMVTPALKEQFDDNINELHEVFSEPEATDVTPVLKTTMQVTYGNWRKLLTATAADIVAPLAKPSKRSAPPSSVPPSSGPKHQKSSAKASARASAKTSQPEPEAGPSIQAFEPEPSDTDSIEDGFDLRRIEVGNIVVIVCTMIKDAAALKVPGSDPERYVWVAKVVGCKVDKTGKKASFKGKFFRNVQKSLDAELVGTNKVETVTIKESSVVDIYVLEDGEELAITSDNIQTILEFLEAHPIA